MEYRATANCCATARQSENCWAKSSPVIWKANCGNVDSTVVLLTQHWYWDDFLYLSTHLPSLLFSSRLGASPCAVGPFVVPCDEAPRNVCCWFQRHVFGIMLVRSDNVSLLFSLWNLLPTTLLTAYYFSDLTSELQLATNDRFLVVAYCAFSSRICSVEQDRVLVRECFFSGQEFLLFGVLVSR